MTFINNRTVGTLWLFQAFFHLEKLVVAGGPSLFWELNAAAGFAGGMFLLTRRGDA